MRKIYACRLGSWQGQVARVVDCCETREDLGLLWRKHDLAVNELAVGPRLEIKVLHDYRAYI